jgi:L-ascorbate metabolism protein UlaG (beta-lactamase superfamily)
VARLEGPQGWLPGCKAIRREPPPRRLILVAGASGPVAAASHQHRNLESSSVASSKRKRFKIKLSHVEWLGTPPGKHQNRNSWHHIFVNLKSLKVYAKFARQHGSGFLKQRRQDRQRPILPAPFKPEPAAWSNDDLTVAWLGHATVLMNFYGTWLLTDPALRSYVGVTIAGVAIGPRRLVQPALSIEELPPLDAVLVSHAHMDHCDLGTLKKLPRNTHVITQSGNRDLVRRFRSVSELAWGDVVEVNGAAIEALEVNHWGARRLTDKHRGYGGFLISKGDKAVVFGGDTAYTRAFSRLRRRFTQIDLAILPIGAYDPYIHAHANPEQAWQMSREMNATFIMPMHHSTFRLSREPVDEPITRLVAAAGQERWRIALGRQGETWVLPKLEPSLTVHSSAVFEPVAR